MKNLILLLVLSVSIVACKSQKDAQNTKSEQVAATPNSTYKSSDVIASMEKTPCFGFCPVYKMEIYGDLTIKYIGEKNVDNIGEYTGNVTQQQVDSLFAKAKSINFSDLENEYDGAITDIPAKHVGVWTGDSLKIIKARYNYPEKLHEFIQYFDELFKDTELVKASEEK